MDTRNDTRLCIIQAILMTLALLGPFGLVLMIVARNAEEWISGLVFLPVGCIGFLCACISHIRTLHRIGVNRANTLHMRTVDIMQIFEEDISQIRIVSRTKLIQDELLAVSWHPDRFEAWCLDEDHRREIHNSFGIKTFHHADGSYAFNASSARGSVSGLVVH